MDTKQTCYLFFDYDNTVRVNDQISSETCKAMEYAQSKGHKLILCTGRAQGSHIENFDLIAWDGVIFGGADIFYNGICYEEHIADEADILAWLDYCMHTHRHLILEGQKENVSLHFETHDTPLSESAQATIRGRVQAMMHTNPLTKMSIMGTDFSAENLPQTGMNPIVHPRYLEVFGRGCDKGTAIKHFCRHLGILIDQCACFGDSMNDYAMFCTCPVSVAMKWAPQRLIDISTYTATTDEGVAEGIAWLLQSR